MSRQFVQNKYNVGDVVSAKSAPKQMLVIRRYVDQVYYCKIQDDPDRNEMVYYERELVEDLSLIARNINSANGENENGIS